VTWHTGNFVKPSRRSRRGWWIAAAAVAVALVVAVPAVGWWEYARTPVGAALAVAPSGSASAPVIPSASDRGQCDYVTVDELSAAVTRGAGRPLAAVGATESQYDCVYTFPGRYQSVRADFSTVTEFRPGTASQVLTVDGFRALYDPGQGNRALSVYTETGNFSVIVWLDGVDDSLAKKIAIEVFRVALPRLP
jgi:hypothetical protein